MKFITVRDIRTTPAQIWKKLSTEQELVITNNGKPIALLTPLSDTNLEETLDAVRKAKAMNSVKKMQKMSQEIGNNDMTSEEIDEEIKKYRRSIK